MRRRTFIATALATPAIIRAWQAEAQTPRDTIVHAKQIDDIISLDPGESFEFSGSEACCNIYDRLLGYDLADVTRLHGIIAESWNVAADGKTYTFVIKPNLTFHSGNPIRAQDAAWSLQRAVILNKSPSFILRQFGFTPENVAQRVRATNDRTLVIETGDAVAPTFFYYCLTATVASVVDSVLALQHVTNNDYGNAWIKTNSAGSGAYRVRAWEASNNYTLEANDRWQGGQVRNRRVVVRHVAEPAAQRLLLERGDADYARNLTRDQLNALRGNANFPTQSGNKGAILYLGLNQRNQFLRRPQVVEAMKYLVDYEGIQRNLLEGTFVVHQSYLPTGFLGAISDNPYRLDIARARALLAQAGLADGFQVTMDVRNTSPIQDIAQAIQQTAAQAGVRIELIPGTGAQTLTKYRARTHDIYIGQWGPDYQDPHTNAETFAMNPNNADDATNRTLAWRNAWDIPQMTARIAGAVRERDAAARVRVYEETQREHQRTSPFVIMFQQIEVAARRRNVDGFVIGPSFDNNYYHTIVKS